MIGRLGQPHRVGYWAAARRSILIAFTVGCLLAVFGGPLAGGRATASDVTSAGPRLMIMGDSITASYNDDDGDERQGRATSVPAPNAVTGPGSMTAAKTLTAPTS